ncbi:SafA/ExsA family spore coat assembly protein [Metabacillus fastidiosus]|uniref:SafA/ExsA family spore coat assembly protein n=1 Tax=Metabacillus fastidiosus TaxID=1458 RepID=UPI003D2CD2AC
MLKIHIVQKGDTLWNIAKKYGVDFEALKSMNTQLSNPDLIMPGMKIKVPSGNVHVKKEKPMSGGQKKEMPIVEHPFVKEKPKVVEEFEEMIPIQKEVEKPSTPYVPPVPSIQQPVYPEIDVNNYYMVNMEHLAPQFPQMPPKPKKEAVKKEVPVKEEKKVEKKVEQPAQTLPVQQEEALEEIPQQMPQQMPSMPQMPVYTAPVMQPPPQGPVPTSPVMPGYGFCYPPYPIHGDCHGGPPVHCGPHPGHPYGLVPVTPVLPGYGFNINPFMGGYGGPMPQAVAPEMMEDYEEGEGMGNIPYPPGNLQGFASNPNEGDCGCGSSMPSMSYAPGMYQQPYPQAFPQGGMQGQQPYPQAFPQGGMQGQQPYPQAFPQGGMQGQQPYPQAFPQGGMQGQQPYPQAFPQGGMQGQQPYPQAFPQGGMQGQQPYSQAFPQGGFQAPQQPFGFGYPGMDDDDDMDD